MNAMIHAFTLQVACRFVQRQENGAGCLYIIQPSTFPHHFSWALHVKPNGRVHSELFETDIDNFYDTDLGEAAELTTADLLNHYHEDLITLPLYYANELEQRELNEEVELDRDLAVDLEYIGGFDEHTSEQLADALHGSNSYEEVLRIWKREIDHSNMLSWNLRTMTSTFNTDNSQYNWAIAYSNHPSPSYVPIISNNVRGTSIKGHWTKDSGYHKHMDPVHDTDDMNNIRHVSMGSLPVRQIMKTDHLFVHCLDVYIKQIHGLAVHDGETMYCHTGLSPQFSGADTVSATFGVVHFTDGLVVPVFRVAMKDVHSLFMDQATTATHAYVFLDQCRFSHVNEMPVETWPMMLDKSLVLEGGKII